MIKVLIVADWYLPAYKAGGPVRSLSNLVATMTNAGFEFCVLTRDRDLSDVAPYSNVVLDTWIKVGNAKVLYTSDSSMRNFRRRINEIKPEIIYLNSFFSALARKVLLLRRLRMIAPCAVIVAPRGELSPGALSLKARKKKFYLKLAALSGLYRGVLWHATAPLEKLEIAGILHAHRLGQESKSQIEDSIQVASNIPEHIPSQQSPANRPEKQPGSAQFVFVSRVSAKKNLAMAIELLISLKGEVKFDIYGPVDDAGYWQKCEALIVCSPSNVATRYMGPVPHEQAQRKFSEYHFFLFPTLGENFGHVIAESFGGGCPVVTSDQTPWAELEKKNIGWDLPLCDYELWRRVLQGCIDMDGTAYAAMSRDCMDFFRAWSSSSSMREESIRLFQNAVGSGSRV